MAATVDYTSDGRVASLTNADGQTENMTYDLDAKAQTTTDALDNPTTTYFDNNGNPIEVVNALGGVTLNTYDSLNDLLSTTEVTPEGNLTTTYTYDQFGDQLSVTNPDGTTTHTTYNDLGEPLTQTDSLGNVTYFNYDQNGNLLSTTTPGEGTTSNTYDDQGNLVSSTDALGNTTTYTYDVNGDVTRESESTGITTDYTYDANGNQTGSSYNWVNPNNPSEVIPVTTSTAYDAKGNDIGDTNAEGQTTSTSYTPDGYVATTVAPTGDMTENTYDAAGNVIATREQSQDTSGNTEWMDTLSVYDADGNVIAQTDPFVEGTTAPITGTLTTYDALGDVTQTQSVTGMEITLTGSGSQMSSVLTSPGTVVTTTSTTYDDQGRPISSTDQYGHETISTYDDDGRVVDTRTQSVDQNGNVVWLVSQTAYNAQGEVALSTDQYIAGSDQPVEGIEPFYDSLGRTIGSVHLVGVQVGLFNADTGEPVDPLNPGNAPIVCEVTNWGTELYATSTAYNSFGQVSQTVGTDGETTQYEYNSFGQQIATIGQPVAPASVGLSIPTADPAATLVSLRTETTYDDYGNTTSQTTNIYEFVLPNGTIQLDYANAQTTQYEYDQFGNLLETIYPDGSTTIATYDNNGNQTSTTDQMGQTTEYQYDGEGDLTRVTLPAVVNPATGQLVNPTYEYGYDADGNQTSLTYPNGGATTFTYDAQGNELSHTLPLGQTETFEYNAQEQQVSHTDFEGDIVDSVFSNTTGMLDELLYFSPSENPSTDAPAQTTTYEYDAFGRTVETKDASGTTTDAYNSQGQLTQVNSPEGVVNYVYDNLGRHVETFTSATANATTPVDEFQYTYNALGQLASVSVVERNGVMLATPEMTTYEYDLLGNLIQQTAPNGVVTTYAYDSMNRVLSMTDTAANGTPIEELEYTYRADGLKTGEIDTLWQIGTREVSTYSWSYDADDRLTQEVYTSYNSSLSYTDSYTYDLDGNRVGEVQITASETETTADTYDADDRLISEVATGATGATTTTYQYGGSGNPGTEQTEVTVTDTSTGDIQEAENYTYNLQGMTSGAVIDQYDASGNLSEQDTVTYTYDASNDRVGETAEVQAADPNNSANLLVQSNTVTTDLVDNNNPTGYSQILEQVTRDAASGAVVQDLVFTVGLQVTTQASVTPGNGSSGTPLFLFFDSQGSTRLVLDSSLNVQGTYAYDAYGNPVGFDPATAVTEILYTGQELDPLTGAYDNRARDYDPGTGTFTTLDPYAGTETTPISYNKYLYTDGDPVNGSDPTGMYNEDGHFWTTYMVAMATGNFTPQQAYTLAYYSQLPDQWGMYDATTQWWSAAAPLNSGRYWEYGVNYYLHTLTGGDQTMALKNQQALQSLVAKGSLQPWQRGILIHAFGDSFAHVDKNTGEPFGWPPGHALMGHLPDFIGYNFHAYSTYVEQLYTALQGPTYENNAAITEILNTAFHLKYSSRDYAFPEADEFSNAKTMEALARKSFGYAFAYSPGAEIGTWAAIDHDMWRPRDGQVELLWDMIDTARGTKMPSVMLTGSVGNPLLGTLWQVLQNTVDVDAGMDTLF